MTLSASSVPIIILAESSLPRLAWEALLNQQPSLDVWGTAASLEDYRALPATDRQTAVLLDFPELSLNQVSQLSETAPDYGLLCLVDAYDLHQIVTLLQTGSAGILSRNATLPELTQALVAVSRGEIVLPPTMATQALAALTRGKVQPQQNKVEALTEREHEVLTLLAQGMTNKDIAQSLFLSVRTVEAHLRNIYSKLQVNSRTEAALWAVQHGFE